jgi:hypothetical protein
MSPDASRELGADLFVRRYHQVELTRTGAELVRRSRGLALTLEPRTGGWARVFDDPAFAVVPLRDDNIEFLLGVAWRRADIDRDDVVRDLVHAVHTEWSEHVLTI